MARFRGLLLEEGRYCRRACTVNEELEELGQAKASVMSLVADSVRRKPDYCVDIEMIEKMAILEFKYGEAERGKTLLEGLLDRHKKRLDLWNVYIDQLARLGDIQGVR